MTSGGFFYTCSPLEKADAGSCFILRQDVKQTCRSRLFYA